VREINGSRVISVLESGAKGPGFKSQPQLSANSLRQTVHTIMPVLAKQRNCSSSLKGCEGSCGPGGKYWQPTTRFMIYVTCGLTGKNWYQFQNPTLRNRVWATYTHTHTHTHPFDGPFSGEPGTRKVNQSGFYWSKRQWVAMVSAGPYASLHLAPDR